MGFETLSFRLRPARLSILSRVLLLVAMTLFVRMAAAEPSAQEREQARGLMDLGDEKTAAGDYEAALKAYQGADAIMGAPTTGVEVGRTLEKLGKLVEARDAFIKVTRHAWRNQGKTDRADRISKDLVERFAADANVQMLRAEVLDAAGRCSESVHHLKRVIELRPTRGDSAGHARNVLRAARRPGGCGACLCHGSLSSSLPSHCAQAHRALYARHGRVIEAQAVLRRFVASGYDDPEVNRWLKELPGAAARARAEH